jgi:hypothetical protein
MTKDEYNEIYNAIMPSNLSAQPDRRFKWELLKVLWEIRDALKGNLE